MLGVGALRMLGVTIFRKWMYHLKRLILLINKKMYPICISSFCHFIFSTMTQALSLWLQTACECVCGVP